jgi:hypothetical protein
MFQDSDSIVQEAQKQNYPTAMNLGFWVMALSVFQTV